MRRSSEYLAWSAVLGAGACALLVFAAQALAQKPLSGGVTGLPGSTEVVEDERAPHLYSGPRGEVLRMWVREGERRGGGGSVLMAVARPQETWENLLEIRPAAGVNPRDPSVAIGSAGELAIAYQWRRENPRTKQIRVALSIDAGKTWTQPATPVDVRGKAFEPQIAWGPGKSLVVVWSDERRADRVFDIYARRSPDGGVTWDPEQRLSEIPRHLPNNLYARPRLLGDGQGRFWVVWVGLRAGRSTLYLNRSTDGGRTWTEAVPLSGESRSVFGQSLHRVGERMLLVWQDTRAEHDRIYAATSVDAGVTWTPPARVDHIPADASANASESSVLLGSDGEVLVSWQDGRNGRDDIFVSRSTDWGRTWPGPDVRIDRDEPGTAFSRYPKLAKAPDGRVAIAWEDDRDGFEAVYVQIRSVGEKPEWGPEIKVNTPAPERAARLPDIIWGRDGLLYLTWEVWDFTPGAGHAIKKVDGRALRLGAP
jgi:BNR repeat protein